MSSAAAKTSSPLSKESMEPITVLCPKCQAIPYSACANVGGVRMQGFHQERRDAFVKRTEAAAERKRHERAAPGRRAVVVCNYADNVFQRSLQPKLQEYGFSIVRVVQPDKLADLKAAHGASHLVMIAIPHDFKSAARRFAQANALTEVTLPFKTSLWVETLGAAPVPEEPAAPANDALSPEEERKLYEEDNERLTKRVAELSAGLDAAQKELTQAKDDASVAMKRADSLEAQLKEARRENGELQLEITRLEEQTQAPSAGVRLDQDLLDWVRLGLRTKHLTEAEALGKLLGGLQ